VVIVPGVFRKFDQSLVCTHSDQAMMERIQGRVAQVPNLKAFAEHGATTPAVRPRPPGLFTFTDGMATRQAFADLIGDLMTL
jgi:hypothetical protein